MSATDASPIEDVTEDLPTSHPVGVADSDSIDGVVSMH